MTVLDNMDLDLLTTFCFLILAILTTALPTNPASHDNADLETTPTAKAGIDARDTITRARTDPVATGMLSTGFARIGWGG